MLLSIGRRQSEDLVDGLHACHERIRRFTSLAGKLAIATDVPTAEVSQVAGQVARYFEQAYPLHVADEEALISYLVGARPQIARALATMSADHAAHEPAVEQLRASCRAIERDPAQLAARAGELGELARSLGEHFDAHLALEEQVIFPAVRALPAHEQTELQTAARRRRNVAG